MKQILVGSAVWSTLLVAAIQASSVTTYEVGKPNEARLIIDPNSGVELERLWSGHQTPNGQVYFYGITTTSAVAEVMFESTSTSVARVRILSEAPEDSGSVSNVVLTTQLDKSKSKPCTAFRAVYGDVVEVDILDCEGQLLRETTTIENSETFCLRPTAPLRLRALGGKKTIEKEWQSALKAAAETVCEEDETDDDMSWSAMVAVCPSENKYIVHQVADPELGSTLLNYRVYSRSPSSKGKWAVRTRTDGEFFDQSVHPSVPVFTYKNDLLHVDAVTVSTREGEEGDVIESLGLFGSMLPQYGVLPNTKPLAAAVEHSEVDAAIDQTTEDMGLTLPPKASVRIFQLPADTGVRAMELKVAVPEALSALSSIPFLTFHLNDANGFATSTISVTKVDDYVPYFSVCFGGANESCVGVPVPEQGVSSHLFIRLSDQLLECFYYRSSFVGRLENFDRVHSISVEGALRDAVEASVL